MTLNIKLPDEVITQAGNNLPICSDEEISSAIIAALEKMLECGMAEYTTGIQSIEVRPGGTTIGLSYRALLIRLDAGEKP